jgi:2-polyprenyl-3-methyl-5-hydroxy-6-metoxy-1,4-benzoquinol methylase
MPACSNSCYSCVVDNSPLFTWQCHIFISTLLHNCNVAADNIYIHTIDPSPNLLKYLDSAGVNIVSAQRFGDGKYCNKLAQFETGALKEAEHVFLCDCDLAFAQNIDELSSSKVVSGKIVDFPNPSVEILQHIFDKYECCHPDLVDTYTGKSFKTNCNGGLYSIPRKYFEPLGEIWREFSLALLNDGEVLELLGAKRIHIDQITFAMSIAKLDIPFSSLDDSYNFPVHAPKIKEKISERLGDNRPKVLHYHKKIDHCGNLLPFNIATVDASISAVNSTLRKEFNNKIFWDYRYAEHPSLGSGVGSRGDLKIIKRRILKALGIEKAASVLDVGCGDGEIVKGLDISTYIGIDMSLESLDLIKKRIPAAKLFHFLEKEKTDRAEVVICLDVLLHQDNLKDYNELIRFIADKAEKRLIVSGYGAKENIDKSAMCRFYEDLRTSLEKTGKFARIFKIAEYRNLDVLVAEKEDSLIHESLNPNDIKDEVVADLLPSHEMSDLFLTCLAVSRNCFGWHTKQYSRAFEYPWVMAQFDAEMHGVSVAEFGAGISALPILLSMRGADVYTYDHGKEVFLEEVAAKNEWGFFDYSVLDSGIVSKNKTLCSGDIPDDSLDFWYSVSVIEHVPAVVRHDILQIMRASLKTGGRLILTIDLYKDREDLWNYCDGKVIETIDEHGTVDSFLQELRSHGFEQIGSHIQRMPASERIDVLYISACKGNGPDEVADVSCENCADEPESVKNFPVSSAGESGAVPRISTDTSLDTADGPLSAEQNSKDEVHKLHCVNETEHGKNVIEIVRKFLSSPNDLRSRLLAKWEERVIERSHHFDKVWYLYTNEDVKAAGVDPIVHYVNYGWREGRDPSGIFSTNEYLAKYPEVSAKNICPLVHFIRTGGYFNTDVDIDAIIPAQVLNLVSPVDFKSAYELGNKKTKGVPYAISYRSRGIEYTSLDMNALDGAVPVDLSRPVDLPPKDIVMNIGTIEHVVDQEEAFKNVHVLAKSRMVHWVPLTDNHPDHGAWGYSFEFFKELARLNAYSIEKMYIENSFKHWNLVCCSLKKTVDTGRIFEWSDVLQKMLTYNENGTRGVDYR